MGVIAKYKFNNTLEANLLPEFNSGFTSDLYTVTDEVNGEVTTRTIESDSLPTLMRFGRVWVDGESSTDNRTDSLLEVLDMNTGGLTNCYSMFRYCKNLSSITCEWDTNNVTNMNYMFYYCNKLTSLNVSNFNTSNVTTMQNMFNSCYKLTSLDVGSWNTYNVTTMYYMFANCTNLTSLDVSNWNTSSVTNMASMFYCCDNLTLLDVSNWNTSNVTNMQNMFYGCKNLTTLDVSNFDTSKVTTMSQMFRLCGQLVELDVSNWNTSKVNDMYAMFNSCTNLTTLDVSNWDTSGLISAPELFYNCLKLTSLNLSKWDTSNVVGMGYMFGNCYSLTTLDVSNWDTNKVTTMTDMLTNTNNLKYLKCNNITTLNKLNTLLPTKSSTSQGTIICKSDTTNLDTTALQSKYWNILDEPTLIAKYVFDKSIHNNCIPAFNAEFEGYFIEDEVEEGNNEVTRTIESCGMLPTKIRFSTCAPTGQGLDGREKALLELLYLDTNNLTTEAQMFQSCINLTYVNTENMINLHQTNHMFCDCNKLTSLDTSNFNTGNVTNMMYMFSYCYKLTTLDISNFDTSNVTRMDYMFYCCNKLTTLDVSNFDTSNVTNITKMFYNTPLLTDISVLHMDKSSLQKLVDAMPTDLNKTLWYKDVNIDGITHGDNITLKKYMEENVEIVLNSPLLEGDTIEVKDGRLSHYHKMRSVVLDGSEKSWKLDMSSSTDNTLRFYMNNIGQKDGRAVIICPTFNFKKTYTLATNDTEGIFGSQNGSSLFIDISKSKLSEVSVNGFKQWLSENPTTVIYELAEPYYEDITNLQSVPTLKTYLECSMEIDTDLPIDTNVTYRTNLSSVYVMERELDELDNGTDLSDILEGEVNE